MPVDPNGLTSRELLKQSAEELISDINAKRKRDVVMLEGMLINNVRPYKVNNRFLVQWSEEGTGLLFLFFNY